MGWSDVANVLLGSWPGYVSSWGREALAAYIAELEARGMTPEQALAGLRTWTGDAPPNVPELVAGVREDPERPTFEEACRLIYGPGGIFRARPAPGRYDNEAQMIGARREAAAARALELDPWVAAFVHSVGIDWLAGLEVDHDDYGAIRRRELKESWERFVERTDRRDLARLASGRRRGGLGRVSPLETLGLRATPELESAHAAPRGSDG